ncbi:MAG: glycosyltransferase [Candidatus Thiodiazotropha sp. (ex Myrtea spinifera)]|nr:glycosyltransferase [Candidatus Thiodiazotropha sp. (ex Myrtea spinifera)]
MVKKVEFDITAFRAMSLPTEEEIVASWETGYKKPVVSILCLTFNQITYLQDALRGFLIQKTTFPFEVILHDDASTDGTKEIVQEYSSRYPGIIKPIIQTNNQYSQGKKPSLVSFPHASGDYIALCEGDDFWISSNKLEMQVELASQYLDCHLICHSALCLDQSGEYRHYKTGTSKKVWLIADFIEAGGEATPTASLLLHRSVFEGLPHWFQSAPVGDFFLQVLAASAGGRALFINKPLSVYRVNSTGSWSKKLKPIYDKFFTDMIIHLEFLDDYLENQHTSSFSLIESKVRYSYARYLLADSRFREARTQALLSIKQSRVIILKKLFVYILSHMRVKLFV